MQFARERIDRVVELVVRYYFPDEAEGLRLGRLDAQGRERELASAVRTHRGDEIGRHHGGGDAAARPAHPEARALPGGREVTRAREPPAARPAGAPPPPGGGVGG